MTFPDGGRAYLSKFYDDNWMIQYGFMERRAPAPSVDEVLRFKVGEDSGVPELVASTPTRRSAPRSTYAAVRHLAAARRPHGAGAALTDVVGSLQERSLLDRVFRDPDALNDDVAVAMQPPLAAVDARASVDEVFAS